MLPRRVLVQRVSYYLQLRWIDETCVRGKVLYNPVDDSVVIGYTKRLERAGQGNARLGRSQPFHKEQVIEDLVRPQVMG